MVETIGIDDVAALAAFAETSPPLVAIHGDLTLDQLGCQRLQPIDLTLRPMKFDGDVLAFDEACFS
jgi:hypothetical protein